jgi:hypothetical protein
MMKKLFSLGIFVFAASFLFAQKIDAIINAKEVERIEKTLSSDDMRGRKTFTPDIDKAADFIAAEFKAIGLETWKQQRELSPGILPGSPKVYQRFSDSRWSKH